MFLLCLWDMVLFKVPLKEKRWSKSTSLQTSIGLMLGFRGSGFRVLGVGGVGLQVSRVAGSGILHSGFLKLAVACLDLCKGHWPRSKVYRKKMFYSWRLRLPPRSRSRWPLWAGCPTVTRPAGSGCGAAASLAARCSASRWPEFARTLSGNVLLKVSRT